MCVIDPHVPIMLINAYKLNHFNLFYIYILIALMSSNLDNRVLPCLY